MAIGRNMLGSVMEKRILRTPNAPIAGYALDRIEQILDNSVPVWRGLGRNIIVLAEDYADLAGVRPIPPCPAIWVVGGEERAIAFFSNEAKVRPSQFIKIGEMPVDEVYAIADAMDSDRHCPKPIIIGPDYHNRKRSPVDSVAYYSVFWNPKLYRQILDRFAFNLMGNEYLLEVANERILLSVTPEERCEYYYDYWEMHGYGG